MEPKILLADDHIMISKGLRLTIELDLGFSSIKSVTSCSELLKELKKEHYTHLIVDIGLPDGSSLDILPAIRGLYPQLNILVFSAKPTDTYAKAIKSFGINNYLSKQGDEDLIRSRLKQFLFNETPAPVQAGNDDSPFAGLTTRELETLHYLLEGKGTNDIAAALNVTAGTVSGFKRQIFEKTNTNNIKELTELAALYKIS
ncbi:response regulator transcription factor [Dinghuibacter silviterrae]|uniref:DNA-binding NarL/FixJ family response regulator n=1 Tax=Dinghuibacter silviterrae TaxID=1539049 RepID=A0A4R8DHH9_9BACT|nr:response regulator transcription factor [Dinghuibacter silviterrae]TDW96898.1 DNA-binding NarL/FixJ family response regulator [Dinghuibacter silviterrae]